MEKTEAKAAGDSLKPSSPLFLFGKKGVSPPTQGSCPSCAVVLWSQSPCTCLSQLRPHSLHAFHAHLLLNESLSPTLHVQWVTMSSAFNFLSSTVPPFTSVLKPVLSLASHFVGKATMAPSGPLSSPLCTQPLGAFSKKHGLSFFPSKN